MAAPDAGTAGNNGISPTTLPVTSSPKPVKLMILTAMAAANAPDRGDA